MATAKKPSVKTSTKKATVVKSVADIEKELAAKRADLIEAKRSHRAGELVNPRVITATRRDIARLMTALTETSRKETK
ncbi:MAG TPA: 50S ribosomal protein L29 [Candidatus Saccharimonadaceae bacterium]|nr:50S ribosomal protein L29 [Candidatus Saccharimonadaceae bacterium]